VKVPYAKKWQKEADKLRKIVLDCDVTEEMKWGKPCFTYQKKNVAIVIPLKDACALSFFKGALLNDPKHILQKIGQAQAGRWIKFTSLKEITATKPSRSRSRGRRLPSRRFQSMRFLKSCRPGWMQLRSCERHSKRSRRDGGSRTSFMSRVRSRRRRVRRGRRGVSR